MLVIRGIKCVIALTAIAIVVCHVTADENEGEEEEALQCVRCHDEECDDPNILPELCDDAEEICASGHFYPNDKSKEEKSKGCLVEKGAKYTYDKLAENGSIAGTFYYCKTDGCNREWEAPQDAIQTYNNEE